MPGEQSIQAYQQRLSHLERHLANVMEENRSLKSQFNINDDSPLSVEIKNHCLSITIGVKTLAFAITHDPELGLNVTDPSGFAEDVLHELLREEEDGTTPVHLLLDKAADNAAEQGSEHCKLDSEP